MKKILIFLICLIIAGCSYKNNGNSQKRKELSEYKKIVEKVKTMTPKENPPFDYRLVYSKVDDGYRYDLIINNPSITMNHIKALSYSSSLNDKYYPTLGLFEEAQYSLKKDYVNKKEGYYKGIALSGKVKKKDEIKLYISYENTSKRIEEVYRIHYEN